MLAHFPALLCPSIQHRPCACSRGSRRFGRRQSRCQTDKQPPPSPSAPGLGRSLSQLGGSRPLASPSIGSLRGIAPWPLARPEGKVARREFPPKGAPNKLEEFV